MFKERLKGYVAGFVCCTLISVSILVLADTYTTNKEVTYGVRVILRGDELYFDQDSRPFIAHGRTFLPVRVLAEMLGIYVDFDETTNTVYLTDIPETYITEDTVEYEVCLYTECEYDYVLPVSLIGTWNWMGNPYYVFNEDNTGTMGGVSMRWVSANGVLSICITPDSCGNICLAPSDWFYVISGNQLTLTSTALASVTFTYTKSE